MIWGLVILGLIMAGVAVAGAVSGQAPATKATLTKAAAAAPATSAIAAKGKKLIPGPLAAPLRSGNVVRVGVLRLGLGSRTEPVGNATLLINPVYPSYNLGGEKYVGIQWVPFTPDRHPALRYGGISLRLNVPDFWTSAPIFVPSRAVRDDFPKVLSIDDGIDNHSFSQPGQYVIRKQFLDNGMVVEGDEKPQGAYVDRRLTHYFDPKLAYELIPEYSWDKQNAVYQTQELRQHAIWLWKDMPILKLLDNITRVFFAESASDWVLAQLPGPNTDGSGLVSYYVAAYRQFAAPRLSTGMMMMLQEFFATDVGGVIYAVMCAVSSIASPYIAIAASVAAKAVMKYLKEFSSVGLDLVGRVYDIYEKADGYYSYGASLCGKSDWKLDNILPIAKLRAVKAGLEGIQGFDGEQMANEAALGFSLSTPQEICEVGGVADYFKEVVIYLPEGYK
jgi:hypothetical protein